MGDGKGTRRKRCGANMSRKRGVCKAWALDGASRCRMHGGLQQVPEGSRPGARRNRGNLKHGLYAKRFSLPDMLDDYEASEALTGSLDKELQVARSYLAWAITRHQANPSGGVVVSTGDHATKIRAFADLVQDFTSRVQQLETARSKMVSEGKGDEVRSAVVDLVKGLREAQED